MRSSDGRRAALFTGLAFLWSVTLVIAALFVPVYGSATLVDENGSRVLLVVAVPAIVSAAVWLSLWRKCAHGSRMSGYFAWMCVTVLSGFCVIGLASIGLLVVPVAVLLARAAALTPSGSPPGAAAGGSA